MNEQPLTRLARFAPLAGVAYAGANVVGDLTIGKFPDSGTRLSDLTSFYADHHARVAAGGLVFAWSTLLLAAFGCTLWERVRRSGTHPAVVAAVLVGTAVAVVSALQEATTFWILGHASTERALTPAALQAWHVGGSEGDLSGGIALLLIALAIAGIAAQALPRWLAWPALVIGLLQLTPLGFFASLLFLLWAAVAGIALTAAPLTRATPRVAVYAGSASST
jgi:hypothetical protein